MNFADAFFRTLIWRPHRALGALYWHVTGRKVRARNRLRMAAAQSPYAYQMWIDSFERADVDESAQERPSIGPTRPHFLVIVHFPESGSDAVFARAIETLKRQNYDDWELIAVASHEGQIPLDLAEPRIRFADTRSGNAAEALTRGAHGAKGDFILPLPLGAVLPANALHRYAAALRIDPDATVLYGDHDRIDAQGTRSCPWFKPRWNEEMFLAQDYVSPACVIRSDAFRAATPISSRSADAAVYSVLLTVSRQDGARFVHVPHVQCHLGPAAEASTLPARMAAVGRHLEGTRATIQPGPFGTVRVDWPLPRPRPLVSIIVPTRNKVKLLRACVSSLLDDTDYEPFELIVVDNGSTDQDALRYLEEIGGDARVRVLRYDQPYNFSAINNFAVGEARGEYLCLLNNDTEVIDDAWLSHLMRYATRPEVGAVGAKLFYEDGSIQHAGVVVGLGEAAGHAHRFLANKDTGYFRYAHIPQFISAVTAACLVVKTSKYLDVGGLDARDLQIAFNDVDFCLKLEQAGLRNVYAPQAMMIHHESKSRGKDVSPANIARYLRELSVLQNRWNTKTYNDPLHHPQLDRASETFVIDLKRHIEDPPV